MPWTCSAQEEIQFPSLEDIQVMVSVEAVFSASKLIGAKRSL